MNLQMRPESTPTRLILEPSESRSTDRDEEANRVWPERRDAAGSSWTLDIPIAHDPPEEAVLSVVMTIGGGTARMEAVDIGVSVEGSDAPEVYARLVRDVRAYLEASGGARSELLRYTHDAWFKFVSPDQAAVTPQEIEGEETEENALYDFEVPDLDALAEEQGVAPIEDIGELVADFWPEDESLEDFMAAVRGWRHEGNRQHD